MRCAVVMILMVGANLNGLQTSVPINLHGTACFEMHKFAITACEKEQQPDAPFDLIKPRHAM